MRVGVHGLLIVKGDHQGVLLPQVPVEEGWGREEFLEGLCPKAGLPSGCWREGAELYSYRRSLQRALTWRLKAAGLGLRRSALQDDGHRAVVEDPDQHQRPKDPCLHVQPGLTQVLDELVT